MTYRSRDLLALEPLTAAELSFLLDQSKSFQEIQRHPLKKLATLRGKTVALAFFENSTRTRISFGTAASRLGAHSMNLQAEASSLKKGESLLDTVHTLDAMKPDCLVMRHAASGAPEFVARHLEIPVINTSDGTHEHPSQGLLDALTIRDRKRTIENLNITILGDIKHSRVARSNIHLLGKFGCRFTLCGPAMWVPRELEELGASVGTSIRRVFRIEEALEDADVVLALRVQSERLHEPALSLNDYVLLYQLSAERLKQAKADAIVLHPWPAKPRYRDHARSSRQRAILHSGTSDQRNCGAHGAALSVDDPRRGKRNRAVYRDSASATQPARDRCKGRNKIGRE